MYMISYTIYDIIYDITILDMISYIMSAATVTPRFHTASRTISVLEAPPPTLSGTGATDAGSTR